VFADRLQKALRLAKIGHVQRATEFSEERSTGALNRRFIVVDPRQTRNVVRHEPSNVSFDCVLCFAVVASGGGTSGGAIAALLVPTLPRLSL
jgi:hypothetical protein